MVITTHAVQRMGPRPVRAGSVFCDYVYMKKRLPICRVTMDRTSRECN
jgi:hypothetical protein